MSKRASSDSTSKTKTAPAIGKQQAFYTPSPLSLAPNNNVGILIKRVQGSLNRMIEQHVSPLGLTAMQWRPLVMIHHLRINTPAELARHSHVDTGAMTRTLDRLEAKNFITRQRCPDDRRVVRIELTANGTLVAEQILPAIALSLNTHLQGFSKGEIHSLISLLERMLSNGDFPVDTPSSASES
ncbi:MarR family winged helix-turn-helix transcriptional regulator [Pollutimonas harenae]|uniref:MarR family transcriptional regulator n=1 Tax=Pollutimonas harenae TaxID=657015 RepID=A0A853H1I5_9BURK|nr:MarR family transcriptional regulator [Pollutimonas harenae]NYT86826.1 MarR family transcriptional regulator [Pollutimonas harenae]TEA71470.1 MarR family transcriptional regulator [Pollutimonas harenae]